jgi:hypothetical protein
MTPGPLERRRLIVLRWVVDVFADLLSTTGRRFCLDALCATTPRPFGGVSLPTNTSRRKPQFTLIQSTYSGYATLAELDFSMLPIS